MAVRGTVARIAPATIEGQAPTVVSEPVAGQAQISAFPVVLDSGAGRHLRDQRNFTQDELRVVNPIRFATAGGPIVNNTGAVVPGDGIFPERQVRVLDGTPDVDSLGQLCMLEGYSFFWAGRSLPVLMTPEGSCFEIPLDEFVPIVENVKSLNPHEVKAVLHSFIDRVSKGKGAISVAAPCCLGQARNFVEFACNPDSRFGKLVCDYNCQSHRLSLDVSDLRTQQGLQYALDLVERTPPGLDLWGAIPCDPFSPLQNLNIAIAEKKGTEQGKAQKFRLRRNRRDCVTMIENFKVVARAVVRRGGRAHFEWSEKCE